jgi:uncharacterized protein (TIGR00251 family)
MIEILRTELKKHRILRLNVKISANSSQNSFAGKMEDGTIKIKIAAVADKEKANKELVKFLSESLGVPKKNISIISGNHSPKKIIEIHT